MPKEINPKDTKRAAAYELWMKAPNPMVTFFKTFDVTNLVKVSRERNLKFNMLLDYCIGGAAVDVKEFYANVNHFFTLLGKMFFTPYGKEFFTSLSKQIFTS